MTTPMTTARHCVRALLVVVLTTAGVVHGRSYVDVPLGWDPNPEPQVAGYIVYVGTVPGVYDEDYDVGKQTSFVYSRAVDGQRYYFAVAAYSPGPVIGPRSAPVSHVAGVAARAASLSATTASANATPPADARDLPAAACIEGGPDDCYTVRRLLHTAGRLQAIVAAPDGRLFVIADGTHVLVHAPGVAPDRPALTSPGRTLSGLALDPLFTRTRFVYVGEIEDTRDGGREMAIVRYREVEGVLGERAVVVSGLRVSPARSAPFAIGADGQIYVAAPRLGLGEGRRNDPYGGSILRFTREGAVPRDAPGMSPILAEGVAAPLALTWDGRRRRVWITGTDLSSPRLAHLDVAAAMRSWPMPLTHVAASLAAAPQALTSRPAALSAAVLLPTSSGQLLRCDSEERPACSALLGFEDDGAIAAAAAGPDGSVYVTMGHADGTSSLLELRR